MLYRKMLQLSLIGNTQDKITIEDEGNVKYLHDNEFDVEGHERYRKNCTNT